MNNKSLLIHPKSKIIDASNGIRIIAPTNNNLSIQSATNHTIDNIFKLPFNFYFINIDSSLIKINDNTANSNGFSSVNDAVGKSMFNVLKKNDASRIISSDKQVILENRLKIIDENMERLDNFWLGAFSLKMPWYDDNKNIINIFAFSFIGSINLAYATYIAKQIGLPFLAKKK